MLSRLSLRARLVLGVIVLAAVGLAAADVATYASLRSFLLSRTDRSLTELQHGAEHDLERGCSDHDGRPPPGGSPGDYFQLRTSDGTVVCSQQVTGYSDTAKPSPPELPARIAEQAFTVPAQDGGGRYRVR